MTAAVLVLLVVSVNLAGLSLSRGVYRQRELSLRTALGACRSRLTRQLLTETLLLCVPGYGLGLLVAWGFNRLLASLYPVDSFIYLYLGGLPRLDVARLDPLVLGFGLTMTLVSLLLSGLLPAFRTSSVDLRSHLSDGGPYGTTSASGSRLRNALVVTQIALSLLLLVESALVIESYRRLTREDLGIETENRLTAQTVLSSSRYPNPQDRGRYSNETIERLQTIAGVLEVKTTSNLAFSNWGFMTYIEGHALNDDQDKPVAEWISISPGFFQVMGIDIVKGRRFGSEDSPSSGRVVIIDQRMEAMLFPDGDALGQRVRTIDEWRTIVGVAKTVRRNGPLRQSGSRIYVPVSQHPIDRVTWVLKTAVPPETLASQLRKVLEAVDPLQPIYRIETLDNYFRYSISRNRLNGMLMSFFGATALLTACLGLYSVVAFRVAQRIHEVGVRRALGAGQGDIFRMVIGRGLSMVLVGLAVGLLAALGLTRFISGMLFGVGPLDAAPFLASGVVFLLVGFVACTLPALRALRIDPSAALRHE
jgi:putative ABC transport system permease protein